MGSSKNWGVKDLGNGKSIHKFTYLGGHRYVIRKNNASPVLNGLGHTEYGWSEDGTDVLREGDRELTSEEMAIMVGNYE